MKKVYSILLGFAVASVALGATKFDATTDGSDAELVFGPKLGNQSVTAISAISDAAGKLAKVYVRDAAGFYNPSAAATSTAVVVSVANTGNALLVTNDVVVIVYADGSVQKTTISDNTATSITLADGLTSALTTSDKIYEMTQVYQATVGTTLVTPEGNPIVDVPADSPVFISLSAATNGNISATVK